MGQLCAVGQGFGLPEGCDDTPGFAELPSSNGAKPARLRDDMRCAHELYISVDVGGREQTATNT